MPTLAELTDAYLAGPAQLRQAVAGMTREQLVARPVAGKWSTLEVVAHIADFEPIIADRIKRTICFDKPILFGADPDAMAAKMDYQNCDVEQELRLIEAVRAGASAGCSGHSTTRCWRGRASTPTAG